AIHSGAGVLLLYGNYSGDTLNFDMAAEMLEADGIQVNTVRITDDVASAPSGQQAERRGIAGDFFVIKVAGACAETGATLSEVTAAAEEANQNSRTMGIALSSCIIPASGRPIFDISEQEVELGMGLHGEPGIQRGPMKSADEVARQMVGAILTDIPMARGTEVAVVGEWHGGNTPARALFIFCAGAP